MNGTDRLPAISVRRSRLVAERARVEARLKAINQALGGGGTFGTVASTERVGAKGSNRRGRPRGAGVSPARRVIPIGSPSPSPTSLKRAAIAVLQNGKQWSREELVISVAEAGYRFKAMNPLNSLNTVVFSNPKEFRFKDGLVSLV